MKPIYTYFVLALLSTNVRASELLSFLGAEKLTEYVIPVEGYVLTKNTVIKADRIKIMGPIITLGHGLTLTAHNIHFEDKGGIFSHQSSKIDAHLQYILGYPTKKDPQVKLSTLGNPGGVRGADDNEDAKTGLPGKSGAKGAKGFTGKMGELNTHSINLVATTITGKVVIHGYGQPGGEGGDGASGQDGQPGGMGGRGWATCGYFINQDSRRSGSGGAGGKAGAGGDGGDGGIGGLNAEINIFTTHEVEGDIVSLPGANGAGGKAGRNGNPGMGGDSGANDHDDIKKSALGVSITICSINSGRGRRGNTPSTTDLNFTFDPLNNDEVGTPTVEGSTPTKPFEEHGCFGLRGQEAVYQSNLARLGEKSMAIRKQLKKNFILKRVYFLALVTIANISGLVDYSSVIDGKFELDTEISDEVISGLKKDWVENFIKTQVGSEVSTDKELNEFKTRMIEQAKLIVSALSQFQAKDVQGSQDTIALVANELEAELKGSINKLATSCKAHNMFRTSEIASALTKMNEKLNPAVVSSCVAANASDVPSTELKAALDSISSKYLKEDDTKRVFSLPFCDDLKIDFNNVTTSALINFMTEDLRLFSTIKSENIASNKNLKSFSAAHIMNSGDPADLLKVLMSAPSADKKIVRMLLKSDLLEYGGYKLSHLKAPKVKEVNLKNLDAYIYSTSLLLGGK